jgi:hypothetical protein
VFLPKGKPPCGVGAMVKSEADGTLQVDSVARSVADVDQLTPGAQLAAELGADFAGWGVGLVQGSTRGGGLGVSPRV